MGVLALEMIFTVLMGRVPGINADRGIHAGWHCRRYGSLPLWQRWHGVVVMPLTPDSDLHLGTRGAGLFGDWCLGTAGCLRY
jgi:hypothetical protein